MRAYKKKQTRPGKKICSFSLIERVILSAGAMLIFSVSFQIDQMPEGREVYSRLKYKLTFSPRAHNAPNL